MLDLMGAMVLTAAIVVNLNATITMMPLSPVPKLTTVAVAGLWIGLAIALATTGIYNSTATPVPVVGVMAGLPVSAVGAAALLFARVREALLAVLSMVRLRGRTRRGDVAARCCFSRGKCCGMMAQTRAGKA